MKILVINSGSSSIKFKVLDMESEKVVASGLIEEIGNQNSKAMMKIASSGEEICEILEIKDHDAGFEILNKFLKDSGIVKSLDDLDGIGHRVVQGGDRFDKSVIIDDGVISVIDELAQLAPLHNPGHLAGIKSAMSEAPDVPNVAVFDTVFHQTIPNYAYMYALPYELYEKYGVRKYGFHGTSHKFVSEEAANFLNIELKNFNAISLHIGNGASITAIKGGKSIDTSMGISPLEGLMMGTRSGNIDPAAIEYLSKRSGMSSSEIDSILNKKSGLLGICGTSDIREVLKRVLEGDKKASLAWDMYNYRIIEYIGMYFAILKRVDAIIFTAGVGENAPNMRFRVCEAVSHFGVNIDKEKNYANDKGIRCISTQDSKTKIMVVPTDEELAIALEVKNLITK